MSYYIHHKSPDSMEDLTSKLKGETVSETIVTIHKFEDKKMALDTLDEIRETAWLPDSFWITRKPRGRKDWIADGIFTKDGE